jgi:hypothetical protein
VRVSNANARVADPRMTIAAAPQILPMFGRYNVTFSKIGRVSDGLRGRGRASQRGVPPIVRVC